MNGCDCPIFLQIRAKSTHERGRCFLYETIHMSLPAYLHFSGNPAQTLQTVLNALHPDRVAVLVDENTRKHCLPHLSDIHWDVVIDIRSGERYKNLDTCQHIWAELTAHGFGRKSLLVNLGGGVIGDMGGFAAATFKRGIRFVNMPTTLLAAVDANIGGKLGIDFQGFKNHIGVFQDPDAVVIWDGFLQTLPERELRSGFAEVLKHGLIWDRAYWQEVSGKNLTQQDWLAVIRRSAEIKGAVVHEDPFEKGLRKILNFGHTIGHGVETWCLNAGQSLLHGEAISVGMITEAFVSHELKLISDAELKEVTEGLLKFFPVFDIPRLDDIWPLMLQDKKNAASSISFSLLEDVGKCGYDKQVSQPVLQAALAYYEGLR